MDKFTTGSSEGQAALEGCVADDSALTGGALAKAGRTLGGPQETPTSSPVLNVPADPAAPVLDPSGASWVPSTEGGPGRQGAPGPLSGGAGAEPPRYCPVCHFAERLCECKPNPKRDRRRAEADHLVRSGALTEEQGEAYANCTVVWTWECCEEHLHEVYKPHGTCGMEMCEFCAVGRERQRGKRAWRQVGGFGTLVKQVFTLPDQVLDRVDLAVKRDLEPIIYGFVSDYILCREGIDGELGARFDWDDSGDETPGRYRPHVNVTIPAYVLIDDDDAGPMFQPFDPIVDVNHLRELWRVYVEAYFKVPIPEIVFKSQFARTIEKRRHWVNYSVMHVADMGDFTGVKADGLGGAVDPRVWTMRRHGSCYGWLKSCRGWGMKDMAREGARSGVWDEFHLKGPNLDRGRREDDVRIDDQADGAGSGCGAEGACYLDSPSPRLAKMTRPFGKCAICGGVLMGREDLEDDRVGELVRFCSGVYVKREQFMGYKAYQKGIRDAAAAKGRKVG